MLMNIAAITSNILLVLVGSVDLNGGRISRVLFKLASFVPAPKFTLFPRILSPM